MVFVNTPLAQYAPVWRTMGQYNARSGSIDVTCFLSEPTVGQLSSSPHSTISTTMRTPCRGLPFSSLGRRAEPWNAPRPRKRDQLPLLIANDPLVELRSTCVSTDCREMEHATVHSGSKRVDWWPVRPLRYGCGCGWFSSLGEWDCRNVRIKHQGSFWLDHESRKMLCGISLDTLWMLGSVLLRKRRLIITTDREVKSSVGRSPTAA